MPTVKKRLPQTRAEIRVQWNAYLTALAPEARRGVRWLLTEIRRLAPGAHPVFSYRIPGYRLDGQPLLWSAGFTRHVSLYPITARLQQTYAKALSGYKTSAGTVQFPLGKPLPAALVRQLIKGRIAEVRLAAQGART